MARENIWVFQAAANSSTRVNVTLKLLPVPVKNCGKGTPVGEVSASLDLAGWPGVMMVFPKATPKGVTTLTWVGVAVLVVAVLSLAVESAGLPGLPSFAV